VSHRTRNTPGEHADGGQRENVSLVGGHCGRLPAMQARTNATLRLAQAISSQ
jgi:hypothetical protein